MKRAWLESPREREAGGVCLAAVRKNLFSSRSGGLGGGGERAEGHCSDWLVQKCHPGRSAMRGDLAHLIGGCCVHR